MSKKKHEEEDSAAEKFIDQILNSLAEMTDEERGIAMRILIGAANEDTNDPDDLNIRYYSYKGPDEYNEGSNGFPSG